MEWVLPLFIGLCLGFVVGSMAAVCKASDTLFDVWRRTLDDVGGRLEEGKTLDVSIRVSKLGDDDGGGAGGVPGLPQSTIHTDWENN